MISDEKQRTQWGCRSCVIVREVWRRGEGWGWEVVGFITYNTKGSQRGGGGRWWASLHITQRGVRTEIVSHI